MGYEFGALEFSVMYGDEETARVSLYEDKTFNVELLTDDRYTHPFFIMPTTYSYITGWLISRSMSEAAFARNYDWFCEFLGIDYYDPLAFLKKMHGVSHDDPMWVRFKGETLTYDDVKVRDD